MVRDEASRVGHISETGKGIDDDNLRSIPVDGTVDSIDFDAKSNARQQSEIS